MPAAEPMSVRLCLTRLFGSAEQCRFWRLCDTRRQCLAARVARFDTLSSFEGQHLLGLICRCPSGLGVRLTRSSCPLRRMDAADTTNWLRADLTVGFATVFLARLTFLAFGRALARAIDAFEERFTLG